MQIHTLATRGHTRARSMLRVCEGDRHRRGCHGSESVVAELAGVTLLLVMLMAAAIIV